MRFNQHWDLEGKHAFLSPSNYHWINYSLEKLEDRWHNQKAVMWGTRMHQFAKDCIELNQKLPRTKSVFNAYVNDAIGFKMTPEQPLYYSEHCFGTADTISFRKDKLRIHDLKTGVSPVSMMQLIIYAALFFLEYGYDPKKCSVELRIYQEPEIVYYEPEPEEILDIMQKIVEFSEHLTILEADEEE